MKVLVVSKTTNLDLHGQDVKKKISQGSLPKEHLDRLEKAHEDHYRTLEHLRKSLDKEGIIFTEVQRGNFWPNLETFNGVITVGGDGTVLEASHHILDQKLMIAGIRSSTTSVGYLCVGDELALPEILEVFRQGDAAQVPLLSRLVANISYKSTGGTLKTDPILNDFLYTNTNPAATTRYKLCLGTDCEEQKSSGIWISTASGSTAAIGAANGMLQDRSDTRFQFLVRELYNPPERAPFKLRNAIFDANADILKIENRSEHALLALDGQHGSIPLSFGDTITFLKGPSLRLLRK